MESREYRHKEAIRIIRTKPLACQEIMKNYFQCKEYNVFDKNLSDETSITTCLEKYNYNECLNENKDKIHENWIFNYEEDE